MSVIHKALIWAQDNKSQTRCVEWSWKPTFVSKSVSESATPVQIVDFLLCTSSNNVPSHIDFMAHDELVLGSNENENAHVFTQADVGNGDVYEFLKDCIHAASKSYVPRLARVLIPLQAGQIIRADILPLRLQDAFWVEKVTGFASPLQAYPGTRVECESASIIDILKASMGAALLKPTICPLVDYGLERFPIIPPNIEQDFEEKLSFNWISTQPLTRKRLVVVGCSNQDPAGGGWTQFAHRAAVALGIDLIIIERGDWWITQREYASWYEHIIPAPAQWWEDPSRPEMIDEIVDMVQTYCMSSNAKNGFKGIHDVDGIVTFIEAFQVPISAAAAKLNLTHQSTSAFETATNKYNLGKFQNRTVALATSASEVLSLVESQDSELDFPLIVKPCFGLNSDGVSRVDSAKELSQAITVAKNAGKNKHGGKVLVEPYCNGPEADVNIVLIDGEVHFCEICDDFPKSADLNLQPSTSEIEPDTRRNFHETAMVFPSALPEPEQISLKAAVEQTIKGMGFTTGIMHVEARVANSATQYTSINNVVDLHPAPQPQDQAPTPWIIEVNPRPPGLFASQTPESVYGISYWGLSLLLAIDDKDRARALSQSFTTGAQSHTVLVMIPVDFDQHTCEGIFDSDDVCVDLLTRRPELRQHIGRAGCLLKRGQKVPHPSVGKNTFVAYLNVFSRTSRTEALKVAETVRQELRYRIR
ncbi:glutathione synthetase ATP-binding domain-like protein [Xylariaceae sp. FL1019]|nr:glutathione synthetase ATP-binding domain-like protein [Xylariaceae sp. FL1019]